MPWSMDGGQPTYQCNPLLLKHFRSARGWTQAEFAEVSGYSERLINKAESGRSISRETVADLADALQTPEMPVFPEDLVYDPIQFARQYIDALYIHQEKMVPVIEPFLDPDVTFVVPGEPAEIPFAGTFRGVAEVEKMIEIFFSILQVPDGHDHQACYQFIGNGNQVVIWGETWIHPIGQPLQQPIQIANRLQFKRGKLFHFEDRFDTKVGAASLSDNRGSDA